MFNLLKTACLVAGLIVCYGVASAGAYDDILIAAENGRTDEVADLVRRGMDINTTDKEGSTLLLIATRSDSRALVDFLLSHRASTDKRNRFGDTALTAAALQGNTSMVKALLASGAEINSPGWTPLHYAAYGGHLPVVEVLIGKAAKLDLRAPNGQTALMLAAKNGHQGVIIALIKGGADQALVDSEGKTYEALLQAANDKGVHRKQQ